MKEFFENLKQIRESKNITLNDIARKSRLSLKFLEDIEKGNLENLPKGYDRIFFKRYLKEIGEDKEEVWRDFNLFFGAGPLHDKLPYSSDIEKEEQKPSEQEFGDQDEENLKDKITKKVSILQSASLRLNLDKIHKYFWILFTIVILSVIGYFAYQQYLFVKSSPLEVKEVSVSDYISEMQRQDSLLTRQIKENTKVETSSPGTLLVELHSVERTWIREVRDQSDTTDYILIPGLKRKIQASRSVQLMLGRADGVEIWLNGDSLGIMGQKNEVVLSLLLSSEGIQEKRLKQVSPKTESESLENNQNP
jgi:cytoskeletal protein RodZ